MKEVASVLCDKVHQSAWRSMALYFILIQKWLLMITGVGRTNRAKALRREELFVIIFFKVHVYICIYFCRDLCSVTK